MMHPAHKAVHSGFIPAEQYKGRYDRETFPYPSSVAPNAPGLPMWVENQRNSWHGVSYPYPYPGTVHLGDNGFMFGEHRLIDRRTAYEEPMRTTMLARCPALFPAGSFVEQGGANIDLPLRCSLPLDFAGRTAWLGPNALPLVRSADGPCRDELRHGYYWERIFPQTRSRRDTSCPITPGTDASATTAVFSASM